MEQSELKWYYDYLPMQSQIIREKFLAFFAEKGHKIIPSASLVPLADPSLLLINAGMAPLKRYFEGKEAPPAPRLASCQKCIRTVDIDRVGYTNRHNTFFEMLGNFSLGDYFKREAILFAWEFVTEKKWLGIDPSFLYVSCHENDEVAPKIWDEEVGISRDRIILRGDEHNLWTAGDIGPCGYDTEIFFDLERDAKLSIGDGKRFTELEESGRLLELWNLVFMEFYRDEDGKLSPLPKKNIDTGMGLERACAILQGKTSVFESDLFDYLVEYFKHLVEDRACNKSEDNELAISADELAYNPYSLLADHIRAAVFLLADGVTPSNLERGYVLRRLIRRIIKTTFLLGVSTNYLREPAELIISRMGKFYPELVSAKTGILTWLSKEEEHFLGVLERGSGELLQAMREASAMGAGKISGRLLFTLHDTFGFPFEVAREFAKLKGFEVNDEEFELEMEKQRQRARLAHEFSTNFGKEAVAVNTMNNSQVKFVGYESLQSEGKVIAVSAFKGKIEKKGKDLLPEIPEGKELFVVVTDATPFYAEAGGQPADTGYIRKGDTLFRVIDSKNIGEHIGYFEQGSAEKFTEGCTVELAVDKQRRYAIMRAHTMAHACLKALRDVLGEHVSQAGSQLYPDRIRFDFSHYQALTDEEMRKVEEIVNEIIIADLAVWSQQMPLVQAKREGVTAVFDEKYGEIVRVINIGEEGKQISRELCGGTHLSRTSQAASFVLIREESVQSGIRRIEAAVGLEAIRFHQQFRWTTQEILRTFNIRLDELIPTINKLRQQLDNIHEELATLKRSQMYNQIADRVSAPEKIGDISVVIAELSDASKDDLKSVIDRAERELKKSKVRSYAILLANKINGRITFSLKVSEDLPARGLKAGELIREVAKVCGGGGGGKDLFAEAGGRNADKLSEAVMRFRSLLSQS